MYATTLRNVHGDYLATVTDEQIDALPAESLARKLRDDMREGVYVTPGEIISAYVAESEVLL